MCGLGLSLLIEVEGDDVVLGNGHGPVTLSAVGVGLWVLRGQDQTTGAGQVPSTRSYEERYTMPQWTLHLQPTQTGVTFKVRSQSKGKNFNRLSKFWKDNQSLFFFLLVLFLSHLWYPKSTQYCWYTSLNRVCGFGKIMLKNKIKGIEGFNLSTITHAWRSQKNYEIKW